jgi:hypothetical protein
VEPLVALRVVNRLGLRLAADQPIAQTLVIAFQVAVLGELLDRVAEMIASAFRGPARDIQRQSRR